MLSLSHGTYHQPNGSLGKCSQAQVHSAQVLPLHEISRREEVDVDETHFLPDLMRKRSGWGRRGEETGEEIRQKMAVTQLNAWHVSGLLAAMMPGHEE